MKLPDFKNEPLSDFKNNPAHRRRMEYALDEIREELGREYDLVIAGERIQTKEKLHSNNPSHPNEVVGVFSQANAVLADRAVRAADEAFKSWSRTPVQKRVELLLKTVQTPSRPQVLLRSPDGVRGRQDLAGSGRGRGGSHRFY